ncbi:MAG: hypothetical protein ACT4OG_02695 [Alphaproteobacteria bacterium]
MTWLRSLAAIIAGYASMVGGAWFAQEVMFPDVEYGKSALGAILALGFFTSALGGLGGAVTAMIAPSRPFMHLLPMAALISLETVTLYIQGRVHGPLWFELLAGASLIAGTFVCAWIWLMIKQQLLGRRLSPGSSN